MENVFFDCIASEERVVRGGFIFLQFLQRSHTVPVCLSGTHISLCMDLYNFRLPLLILAALGKLKTKFKDRSSYSSHLILISKINILDLINTKT